MVILTRLLTVQASLVICVATSKGVYIGADSLASQPTPFGTNFYNITNKMMVLSTNAVVAITGDYGDPGFDTNGRPDKAQFPFMLQNLCDQLSTNNRPWTGNVSTLVSQFAQVRAAFPPRHFTTDPADDDGGTGTVITGYDESKKAFVTLYCAFRDGRDPELQECLRCDDIVYSSGIQLLGENKFLTSFLNDRLKYAGLCSPGLTQNLSDIHSNKPISEERAISVILELFRLHKENSRRLGFDKGWIGPPYVIYKISKDGVVRLQSQSADSVHGYGVYYAAGGGVMVVASVSIWLFKRRRPAKDRGRNGGKAGFRSLL